MKYLLALLILLLPLQAHADLFEFVVTVGVFIALGPAGFGLIATWGGVGLAIGMAAYGQYKAEELRRQTDEARDRARDAYNASLKDRTVTNVATESPFVYVYGRARVGSSVVAILPSGPRDEYKHIIAIHAAHECDGFEEIYIGSKALGALDPDGFAINSPEYSKTISTHLETNGIVTWQIEANYVPGSVIVKLITEVDSESVITIFETPVPFTQVGNTITVATAAKYRTYYQYKVSTVRVKKHLGVPGEAADATLIAECPTKWTLLSKLSGFCYTYVRLDQNQQEFQSGLIGIEALLRGKKLYDPRTATTAWSQNNALVLRDYLLSDFCAAIDSGDVPDADVIIAANVCDEVTAFGARYTFNGTVTSEQDQDKVIGQICQSMAGGVNGTTWEMWAGKYVAPTLTLEQTDIVGSISILPGVSDADLYNGATGRFIGPENGYAATDMKPFQNPTYLAADGRELFASMEFPYTDTTQGCHNLARIFVEDQRNSFTVKASFSLKAWDTKIGQRIALNSSFFGWTSKVFRIIEKSYLWNSTVDLTLKEDEAGIWDQADAVVVDSTPNTGLANPFQISPPTSITVTSGATELLLQADGTVVSRMKVVWPIDANIYAAQAEIEFKLFADSIYRTGAVVASTAGFAYLTDVLDNETYDVRIRYVNPYLQTQSIWVNAPIHMVIGKTAPPSNLTSATTVVENGKLRLLWDAITDVDLSRYEIRTTDTGWGGNGAIHSDKSRAVEVEPAAVGISRSWYGRAVDTSGNVSAVSLVFTYTVPALAEVTGLTSTFVTTSLTNAVVTLDWADASPPFLLAGYEVSYGAVVKFAKASTISLPADWVGNRTFTVKVVDMRGNKSTGESIIVAKSAPAVPTLGTTEVSQATLVLGWSAPATTTLPVIAYEVRTDELFGTDDAARVFYGSATQCSVSNSFLALGLNTFYVRSIDTNGVYSTTSLSIPYTVAAPANTSSVTYSFSSDSLTNSSIVLDWADVSPIFGIRHYEVSYGAVTKIVNASTITLPADWTGTRTFTVKTVDRLGNLSSGTAVVATKNAPGVPTSGMSEVSQSTLLLSWSAPVLTTLPVLYYEVRKDENFGVDDAARIFLGSVTRCSVPNADLALGLNTFYVRSIDTDGVYSATSLSIAYTVAAPANTAVIDHQFADSSLTNATVTLDWSDVAPPFGLRNYEVSYPGVIKIVNASTITLPANWLGDRTFTVKTADRLGNLSSGLQKTVAKFVPNPVSGFRAQVIDNNVLLYWTLPAKTSLPIQHVLIKQGAVYASAVEIGTKDGSFTSYAELQSGDYRYWAVVVDTDGNESSAVSLDVSVGEPPDFIFTSAFTSDFGGTKTNAARAKNNSLLLPVNATQTWSDHFTTNGWATHNAQVAAGYPIFAEPSLTSASYVETFDVGTVIGSSAITLAWQGVALDGTVTLIPKLELSVDNVSWTAYDGQSYVFGTNFRYVRATITATAVGDKNVYRIERLTLTVATKLVTDEAVVACVSTDASGTIVNFNRDFIDVKTIICTPAGVNPSVVAYDFQDAVLSGTYSVTSNVATVNVTGHDLIVGQKVRLMPSTGTMEAITATVTSVVNANQYTAAVITGDTSGNLQTYPQSMRVYRFSDMTGTRESGNVSWFVKGV